MNQLVILSGKGGTGKTSITAAFAHLFSLEATPYQIVLADALYVQRFFVFTAHRPAEGIVIRSHAGMDRPQGRNYRLQVSHNDMARLIRLAHHVEEDSVVSQIEIHVYF